MRKNEPGSENGRTQDPGFRKTRRTVYRSYHYLIWKLANIHDQLLANEQAREAVKDAVSVFCEEQNILIQELAVWKESVHLVCSLRPRHTVLTVGEGLKKVTADRLQSVLLGLDEFPWAEDFFSQTISFEHLEEAREMARSEGV